MPAQKKKGKSPDLPSTIERSDRKAQETWAKAHDSAIETYGEGGRAQRVAYAALKHSYRKSGDKWVPKESKGPSDRQAARGPTTKPKSTARQPARTGGGRVTTAEASREDLYEQAKRLDISGRSRMSKQELAQAVRQKRRK